MTIEFRQLTTADELAVLPEFEHRIWGGEMGMVSLNMLVATVSEGGMAIAAYDGGLVVGVVYGFRTHEADVLHSHYMAVDPSHRGAGLATELKLRQRQWCLDNAMTAMRWTYDPLQLANAHLNLNRLGARGVSYHVNHYGLLGGINGMLPSDRVTVRWELLEPPGAQVDVVEVEVLKCTPDDIANSTPAALAARQALRDDLAERLADGWSLTSVDRDRRRYQLGRR